MKTNKAKKIASIVIVSVVLLLTLTTIILAIVPVKLYDPVADGFKRIVVYKDTVSNGYIYGDMASEEQKGVCNNILEYHEKSLKDNVLSNMFQGTSSFETTVVDTSISDLKSYYDGDGIVCLIFEYFEEQTLMMNGEVYKDEQAFSSKPVTFNKIFMPITDNDSFTEGIVYLADNSNKSSYQIKFLAHQSELYDYIIGLDLSQTKVSN